MFLSQDRQLNIGLFCMRIGPAVGLLYYAAPKLWKGAGAWEAAGRNLPQLLSLGCPVKYAGLGLLLLQALGALSLISGYFMRIFCLFLSILFALHCHAYFMAGKIALTLYALGLFSVCFGLIFTGPGGYAITLGLKGK